MMRSPRHHRAARALLALALTVGSAGCLRLPVDEATLVRCEASEDCPEPLTRCRDGLCVQPDANETAAASVTSVERGAASASIQLTVSDLEGDPLEVTGAVTLEDGSTLAATLEPSLLETTNAPAAATLTWRAADDLGDSAYRAGVTMALTLSDPGGATLTLTTPPFDVGNTPPVASVDIDVPPAGVVNSLAVVRFTLADDAGDLVALTAVDYSRSGDFADAVPVPLTQGPEGHFPAGSLINLLSGEDEGAPVTHSITWNTALSLPDEEVSDLRLRLTFEDSFGGVAVAEMPAGVALDNTTNAPPLVAEVARTMAGDASGQVTLTYALSDPESDTAELVVEHLRDSAWLPATPAGGDGTSGLATAPTPTTYAFIWDSVADGVALSAPVSTQVRIAARGPGLGPFAVSAPFVVDNTAANAAPAAQVLAPGGIVSGDSVVLNTLLSDAEGDDVDLTIELSRDGASWTAARPGDGGDGTLAVSTAPGAGSLHTFIWDTIAPELNGDEPVVGSDGLYVPTSASSGVIEETVFLRVTPAQTGDAPALVGTPSVVEIVVDNGDVFNAAPAVVSVTVPSHPGFAAAPVLVRLSDPEAQRCAVAAAELSVNGGASWSNAALLQPLNAVDDADFCPAAGVTRALRVSPMSALSSTTSLAGALLRVRAEDAYRPSPPVASGQAIAGPRFADIVQLTDDDDDHHHVSTTVDAGGRLHLTWWRDTPSEVVYARSDDGGLTAPAVSSLAAEQTLSPSASALAVDDQARLHLVWQHYDVPPDRRIAYARSDDDGLTWSAPLLLSAPGDREEVPSVAVDGDTVAVAWADVGGSALEIRTSVDGGDTFGAPTAVTLAGYGLRLPQLAIDGGRVGLAFTTTGAGNEIYVTSSTDEGQTFDSPLRVDDDGGVNSTWPSLTTDRRGRWHLAYRHRPNDGPGSVALEAIRHHTSDDFVWWSAPTSRLANGQGVAVAASDDGVTLIASREDTLGDIALVFAASGDRGETFSVAARTAFPVDDPDAVTFAAAVWRNRRAHVAWSADDDNGREQIYAARLSSEQDGFANAIRVSEPDAPGYQPSLYRAVGGVLAVVVEQTGEEPDLSVSADDGLTWTTHPTGLAEEARNPTLVGDHDRWRMFWVAGSPTSVRTAHSDDQGQSWSEPAEAVAFGSLIRNSAVDAAREAGGRQHVVWSDQSSSEVVSSTSADGEAPWTAPLVLNQPGDVSLAPAVCAGDGVAHVVWVRYQAPYTVLHRALTDGVPSTSELVLYQSAEPLERTDCVVAADGAVHVVWDRDDGRAMWTASVDGGVSFRAAQAIGPPSAANTRPALTAGPAGDVTLAFTIDDGERDVTVVGQHAGRHAADDPAGWGLFRRLDFGGQADGAMAIATTGGGLVAAFTDGAVDTRAAASAMTERFVARPTDTPLVLPSDGAISSSITLEAGLLLWRPSVTVEIAHPDRGALRVELVFEPADPDQAAVALTLHDGDEAGAPQLVREWTTDGRYRLDGSALDELLARSSAGTWTLTVTNLSGSQPGTLVNWALAY